MSSRSRINGTGNSRFYGRGVRVSNEREMRAFDRLPPVVRKAFREAVADSSATGLTRVLKVASDEAVASALTEAVLQSSWEFYRREIGRTGAVAMTGRQEGLTP